MITTADFKSTLAVDLSPASAVSMGDFVGWRPPALGALLLRIESRTRTDSRQMVSCNDFVLSESSSDEDLCAAVAERPNVTPYCLDHKNRRMIFAETPPQSDLSTAPFYYQRQFETASRLIALPYECVHQIAMRLPAHFEELVLIYSVGRCGSTLVSKMWQRLYDTYSLSEPDVLSEVGHLHAVGRMTDGEALQLLGSASRLLFRPADPRKRFVLKFRTHCIESAELMHWIYPAARLVFMYRNAVDCIDSHVRVFGAVPLPKRAFRCSFLLAEPRPEVYEQLGRLAGPLLGWLGGTHRYRLLRECGLPFVALKYEELVKEPHRSMAQLFAHCGVADALVEQACAAMAEDSQAGTRLARNTDGKRTLTVEESESIRAFLAEYADTAPNATLAGTLNT